MIQLKKPSANLQMAPNAPQTTNMAFRKRSVSKADSFDGNTEVSFGET